MYSRITIPAISANFINRVKGLDQNLVAYEMGSMEIQNPAGGLLQQLWTLVCDNNLFTLYSDTTKPYHLFSDVSVTECDLAFDQNMYPFVTYLSAGVLKYRWYDPTTQTFEVVSLGTGFRSPRCTLDDKRHFNVSNSDIILSYIDDNDRLLERVQRDRYANEYILAQLPPLTFISSLNFNEVDRLQWAIGIYTTQFSINKMNTNNANIVTIINGEN